VNTAAIENFLTTTVTALVMKVAAAVAFWVVGR
jgi:hypothetical protein